MCMDQNKVIVLCARGQALPYEHTNIRTLHIAGRLFNLAGLLYVMSNRSRRPQKKTDFIFTDDRNFYALLRPFGGLIPADILFREDAGALARDGLELIKYKKARDKRSIK